MSVIDVYYKIMWGWRANFCFRNKIARQWASAKLQRWTDGATCSSQGDHLVGHWPTF